MHCKASSPPLNIDHAVLSALSLLFLACILTLPAHPDDVPSFKKTSKHLILDSIFFITTMLMMGCCASNQVRKLLQTDHIWNFTIAVLPFPVAILYQPRRGCPTEASTRLPTVFQSKAGKRCLLCAKSSYFVKHTK